jgi:hypothetical protein
VDAVSVVLSAVALLKVSELEERLHVVGLEAPAGAVTAQVSVTVPVNELPGVTVIVAVLPVVAPGLTLMLPLLERLKPVVLLLLGASQKSPQPAISSAVTGKIRAQFPIFIAAPFAPSSGRTVCYNPLSGYRLRAPSVFQPAGYTHAPSLW